MHAGCVFVASILPSRTWMSGSFESMWWNACVRRLDLGWYSHLKKIWGNGVRTYVNSKGKIPSTRSTEEDWTNDAASCRTANPTHYLLNYPGPHPHIWELSAGNCKTWVSFYGLECSVYKECVLIEIQTFVVVVVLLSCMFLLYFQVLHQK